jgi:hypothetical protein
MVLSGIVGCANKPKNQADNNSIIQKQPENHEIHGEVGAMYGTGGGRR